LTLPPTVPLYIPVIASAFAIIVGKAIFGGVGHFLWQPALVGRLAVAVMFPALLNPIYWPILAQDQLVVGDAGRARRVLKYTQWAGRPSPSDGDGFLVRHPAAFLRGLTDPDRPRYSALATTPAEQARAKPAALRSLPPISDLMYGARPGGIGETCAVIILVSGLYLVYRNYVKWQLPMAFLLAAAATAGIAPIFLAGPNDVTRTVWLPLLSSEGPDIGFTYVNYQLLSGGFLLAAFFLATEMTSRPVTTGGQVLFGLGCGLVGMLLKLYVNVPIPAYVAVLAMNTLTPTIDAMWRPRVMGQKRLWDLLQPATRRASGRKA
jgi:electron transport complex protein RnfD